MRLLQVSHDFVGFALLGVDNVHDALVLGVGGINDVGMNLSGLASAMQTAEKLLEVYEGVVERVGNDIACGREVDADASGTHLTSKKVNLAGLEASDYVTTHFAFDFSVKENCRVEILYLIDSSLDCLQLLQELAEHDDWRLELREQ